MDFRAVRGQPFEHARNGDQEGCRELARYEADASLHQTFSLFRTVEGKANLFDTSPIAACNKLFGEAGVFVHAAKLWRR